MVKTGLPVGQRTQDAHERWGTKQPRQWNTAERKGGIRGCSQTNGVRGGVTVWEALEDAEFEIVTFLFPSEFFLFVVFYRKCKTVWFCRASAEPPGGRMTRGHAAADTPWAMKSADRYGAMHHFSRFTRGYRAEIESPLWTARVFLFFFVWSPCAEISSKPNSIWDIWDLIQSMAVTTTV